MREQQDFGSILRRRRELLGYSLEKVSLATNVRPSLLKDFENSDFDRIPPRGYAQGIIGTYARYLGLDASTVLDAYYDDLAEYEDQVVQRDERMRERSRTGAYGDRSRRNADPAITSGRAAVETGWRAMQIPWRLALVAALVVALIGFGVWGIVSVLNRPTQPPPLPVIPSQPTDTPTSTVPAGGEPAESEVATTPPTAPVAAKGTPFSIEIEVPQGIASWVEVDVDGARGFAGTVVGPETQVYEVTESIRALIGKPANVVIKRDGEPIELPIENNVGLLKLEVEPTQ